MTMFEYDGRLLVVDCGMLLGKTNSPGVDITLPDWSYFSDRLEDIDAVVLTHGHEDHIGALPYLLRDRRDIPVIGSRLTLALVARQARPAPHQGRPAHGQAKASARTIGPWDLEFFAVNHSIPDALAVAIRVGGQTVLHTGDFKMDQTPLDGRLTDLPGFSRLGDEGVDLLLADSTNAEVRRLHPVRARRRQGRHRRDPQGAGTHHRRLLRLARAPRAAGARRGGRSRAAGRARRPLDGAQHADRPRARAAAACPTACSSTSRSSTQLPSRRVLLISTGSQGEPLSALSRMANRDHQTIRIGADDTILLASSLIPGNETSVGQVINGLSRLGATGDPQVDGAGARVRATRRPASCATCSTPSVRRT